MRRTTADHKGHAHARPRRRRHAAARLQRDHAHAQRAVQALEQALRALDLPATLVHERESRLRSPQQRLGTIVGGMCPAVLGGRTVAAVARVRGWDNNRPSRRLGALPQRSWLTRWRRLGLEGLLARWRQVQDNSPATRSRWPGRGVADDAVFHTYGRQLGRVGTWWSGPQQRGLAGMDGVLRSVGIGAGTRVIPVDCAIRRPDAIGPGGPCRETRPGVPVLREERFAALGRRGLARPAPVVVAARWVGDATVMTPVRHPPQGTLLVEGHSAEVVALPDGRQVQGRDLVQRVDWPWRDRPQASRGRDARLSATRPTDGRVTWVRVDEPGEDRVSLLCLETPLHAPRLIRLWRRRHGMEEWFRTLTHLLAPDACQVQGEEASAGHVMWRVMGGVVWFDPTRVLGTGRMTRAAIVWSLTHDWRVVDSAALA